MLNDLSQQIRECLQHAEDCANNAAAHADPTLKAERVLSANGAALLSLGRSYEFTERLGDFSDETRRQANKLPKP